MNVEKLSQRLMAWTGHAADKCRRAAMLIDRFGINTVAFQAGRSLGMPLAVMGRWLYCRRCKITPHESGVLSLDDAYDRGFWAEVLAIGPNVCTRRSRADVRKWRDFIPWFASVLRCCRWMSPTYTADDGSEQPTFKVGDLILLPGHHDFGIQQTHAEGAIDDEFLVDEGAALAKWTP